MKAFAMFSTSRWKKDTATFLKSIESKIVRVEMTKIMEAAMQVQLLASQTHKKGAVIFKSLNDALKVMIIQNGYGKSESSNEKWVPTQAITGNIVYLCFHMIYYSAYYQVGTHLINHTLCRLVVMASQIVLIILAICVFLTILTLCILLTILASCILFTCSSSQCSYKYYSLEPSLCLTCQFWNYKCYSIILIFCISVFLLSDTFVGD